MQLKPSSPLYIQTLRGRLKEVLRTFFKAHRYIEVETPVMVAAPGTEVHLNYFATAWQDYKHQKHALYLRSSPELHMKQFLASTKQDKHAIFQMAACFRNNGELSSWHHPEFTMLEYYQPDILFQEFIDLTAELIQCVREHFKDDGNSTRLPVHFERWTLREAFKEFANLELVDMDPDLARKAHEQGIFSITGEEDFETAFFKIILDRLEPAFERIGGVILYDYPASQAALAKLEGGWAKRFEFYAGQVELCNGFDELIDYDINKQRWLEGMKLREKLGKTVIPEDQDYFNAVAQGIPSCCGNAMGFERLLALAMGWDNIDHCIPFRSMTPYRTQMSVE